MQTVSISITDFCPNRCPGCFAYKSKNYMSLLDFKKVIKAIPAEIEILILTGGEPFTHPNLVDMCKYASEFAVKPTVFTSGCVPLDLKKIRNYISRLFVTVKYPNTTDNEWKGNKNCFKNVKKILRDAQLFKIKTFINWSVDRENLVFLSEMSEFAKKYDAGLDVLRFLPYDEKAREIALSDDEWEIFCEEASKYDNVKIRSPSSKYSYDICPAGVQRMNILTNGDVTPCLYWSFYSLGNIFKEDMHSILERLKQWRLRIGDIKGCPVVHYLELFEQQKIKVHI